MPKNTIMTVSSDDVWEFNEHPNPPTEPPPTPPNPPRGGKGPEKFPPDAPTPPQPGTTPKPHDDHTRELDVENIEAEKIEGEGEDGDKSLDEILAELDEQFKKISPSKHRDEVNSVEEITQRLEQSGGGNEGTHTDTKDGDGEAVAPKFLRPVGWKPLLDRLVSVITKGEITTTYQKSRDAGASQSLAASVGGAAMRPGERVDTINKQKLIFIVDASGSMSGTITLIYEQLITLIKKHFANKDDEFYVVKFSNQHYVMKCSIKQKKAEVVDISEIYNDVSTPMGTARTTNIMSVFQHTISGGTEFSDTILTACVKASKKNNAVVLISDNDMFSGDNLRNLKRFFTESQKGSVGVIWDSQSTYENFIARGFGNRYKNFVSFVDSK